MDSETVVVGESTQTFLDRTSLMANKTETAADKIATALGVIAEAENLPKHYKAVIWLPCPLTDIRTRERIANTLTNSCDREFV